MLASGLDKLQARQTNADNLAVQAATGDLTDVADYMIASNRGALGDRAHRGDAEQGR